MHLRPLNLKCFRKQMFISRWSHHRVRLLMKKTLTIWSRENIKSVLMGRHWPKAYIFIHSVMDHPPLQIKWSWIKSTSRRVIFVPLLSNFKVLDFKGNHTEHRRNRPCRGSSGWFCYTSETGREHDRFVSVSQWKNPLFYRFPSQRYLQMFWLWESRKFGELRNGSRTLHLSWGLKISCSKV